MYKRFLPLSATSIVVLIVLVLIIFVVTWFTFHLTKDEPRRDSDAGRIIGPTDGEPEDRYITASGQSVSLSALVGSNILYINTWASWSPLSRDELIMLNDVATEYRDQGIVFIALNRKETREQAERYLATLPPLDALTIIIDTEDYFYHAAAGYAMPETIIFGKDGTLLLHERQPQTKEQMQDIIQQLLDR